MSGILEPLSKNSKFEFVVNSSGKAMLLFQGTVAHPYAWAQYDSASGTVQLVSEEGELQDLGIKIPEHVKKLLAETRDITFAEVGEDGAYKRHAKLVFNNVLS